jgi:hypothetical protein
MNFRNLYTVELKSMGPPESELISISALFKASALPKAYTTHNKFCE